MAVTIDAVCGKCGAAFQREMKRGRPAINCLSCRINKIVPTKDPSPLEKAVQAANKARATERGNARYARAIVIDLLESGEWDDLLNKHMSTGLSKVQAMALIIKSIGG